MHVVGARQLDAPPERVREVATLDERGGYGKPDEREPGEDEQVDAGKDPEACDTQRQEGDEPCSERSREVTPPADRPHERNRAGVGGSKNERPEAEHYDGARRIVELGRSHADERRPDAQCE